MRFFSKLEKIVVTLQISDVLFALIFFFEKFHFENVLNFEKVHKGAGRKVIKLIKKLFNK